MPIVYGVYISFIMQDYVYSVNEFNSIIHLLTSKLLKQSSSSIIHLLTTKLLTQSSYRGIIVTISCTLHILDIVL